MSKKLVLNVILFMLILSMGIPLAKTQAPSYAVTLLDEEYDPVKDEHYFEYKIECFASPGISHIGFEMNGNCNPDIDDGVFIEGGWISGIPLQSDSPEEVNPDPTTGVIGIKYDFDPSIEPGEESVIYFILEGEWVPDGTIPTVIKAALNNIPITAEGPDCMDPVTDPTKITITKQTIPGDSTVFDFLDYNSNPFTLRDYSTEGDVWDYELAPGTYTFEELIKAGWTLDSINLNGDEDSGSVVDLANRKITVDLDEGEWISIWFTNVKEEEPELCTIIVEKEVDWGIDSYYYNHPVFDFELSSTLPGYAANEFSLGDGDSTTFSSLEPGKYIVAEDLMGWGNAEIIIKGGGYDETLYGDTGEVEIEAGETITITFINRPPDYVIPETPYGVLGSLIAMMAVVLAVNKLKIRPVSI